MSSRFTRCRKGKISGFTHESRKIHSTMKCVIEYILMWPCKYNSFLPSISSFWDLSLKIFTMPSCRKATFWINLILYTNTVFSYQLGFKPSFSSSMRLLPYSFWCSYALTEDSRTLAARYCFVPSHSRCDPQNQQHVRVLTWPVWLERGSQVASLSAPPPTLPFTFSVFFLKFSSEAKAKNGDCFGILVCRLREQDLLSPHF